MLLCLGTHKGPQYHCYLFNDLCLRITFAHMTSFLPHSCPRRKVSIISEDIEKDQSDIAWVFSRDWDISPGKEVKDTYEASEVNKTHKSQEVPKTYKIHMAPLSGYVNSNSCCGKETLQPSRQPESHEKSTRKAQSLMSCHSCPCRTFGDAAGFVTSMSASVNPCK